MNLLRDTLSIFWRFLALGCISFGGPAAHIGYFQKTFVERLHWLSQDDYGKLVAVSQFLPGPGSSQVGFAIGLHRGGLAGGMAAFLGFTLPSFCLMYGLAHYMQSPASAGWMPSVIQGLLLLAVVVVADAVLTMAKQFCQSWYTRCIALTSALLLISFSTIYLQFILLFTAGLLGFFGHQYFVNSTQVSHQTRSYHKTWLALFIFALLFIASIFIQANYGSTNSPLLSLAANFYQSGSLVFGGGHVVLPLLQQNIEASLNTEQFLFGYAAAQGVPGPMFTLAAYLGAQLLPTSPLFGATIATLSLFLPGLLLIYALHQQWAMLSARVSIAGAMAAINAAVVGLLLSAWVNPVVSHGINQLSDVLVVVILFAGYRLLKLPIVLLILLSISYGLAWL
jgi:chromate transporter